MISDTHTRYGSQLSRHGKLRACRSYHCRRSSGKFPCDDCKMNSRERFLAMPNPVSQTDFVSSLFPTGVHAQSPRRQGRGNTRLEAPVQPVLLFWVSCCSKRLPAQQSHQFFNRPNVVTNSSSHRWRDTQGLMHTAEIVVHKPKRHSRRVVFYLLRESAR